MACTPSELFHLGPGYRLEIASPGFSSAVFSDLYLNVNDTRTQNAKMKAGTNETVEVSASNEAETINTTDAQIGNNVQVQVLNDLPIANRDSPSALFYMMPGVTESNSSSNNSSNQNGSVTGARTDQSNVTLDGLDVNDNETGGIRRHRRQCTGGLCARNSVESWLGNSQARVRAGAASFN